MKLSYNEFCDIVDKLQAVPEPEEEVQCLSSKRMGEVGEIFAIFGSDDNAGHLSILDLEFAIKSFGINLTGEEMKKLINKERESFFFFFRERESLKSH